MSSSEESRPPDATRQSLSVIMPNFNHSAYLRQSLAAVCEQSRSPNEFIVIDDCSTDNSVEIIEEFAAKYRFLRLIRNVRNLGVSATMEAGMSASSGEYLLFVAADDYVLPGFFERAMKLCEAHPEAALCVGPFTHEEEETGKITTFCSLGDRARFIPAKDVSRELRGWGIPGHTTIWKRTAYASAGGFRHDLRWHCDWFCAHVAAFRGGLCYVPEPVSVLRVVRGSYSWGRQGTPQQAAVEQRILELLDGPEFSDVRADFYRSGVLAQLGPTMARHTIEKMKHLGMDWWPTLLLCSQPSALLDIETIDIRDAAIQRCGELKDTNAIAALAQLFQEGDTVTKFLAANSLCQLTGTESPNKSIWQRLLVRRRPRRLVRACLRWLPGLNWILQQSIDSAIVRMTATSNSGSAG